MVNKNYNSTFKFTFSKWK